MGVPGKTLGTMFTPIPIELTSYEAERVGGKFYIIINIHVCFYSFLNFSSLPFVIIV